MTSRTRVRSWATSFRNAALTGAAFAVAAAGLVALPVSPAAAAPGDGTLTVRVIEDVNADRAWNSVLELGMVGVTVNLHDDSGHVLPATTVAGGLATFNPAGSTLVGGKYRVEVINPNPGVFYPATATTAGTPSGTATTGALSSNEEFVDLTGGKTVSMTTGFWNPGNYCQSNPTIMNACQPGMDGWGTSFLSGRTLFTTDYNFANGQDPVQVSTGATTGSLYGIGVSRTQNAATGATINRVFAGAYAKRSSQYTANGGGAIFVQTRGTTNSGVTLFADIPDAEVGSTTHSTSLQDLNFRAAVGKESLGDIDVSSDGRFLYVVNMFNKQLYIYDATDTSGNAQPQARLDIPNPGCGLQWRPMGLGEHNGEIYVGGVCDQQLTASVATLNMSTQTFTSTWPMLNQPLNYPRDNNQAEGSPSCASSVWHAWADALPTVCSNVLLSPQTVWAQPMLADIEFKMDGSMITSFRDRTGDQYGAALYATAAGHVPYIVPSGDLLLACKTGNSYTFDVNGGCGTAGEFFSNDQRFTYSPGQNGYSHNEAFYGGIVYQPTETTMITNSIDSEEVGKGTGAYYSGLSRFTVNNPVTNVANAAINPLIPVLIFPALGEFGKGQGLADMEAICNMAPIQIGNRVWYDNDKDGFQDGGELPISGVTVSLYDENGVFVTSTVTSTRGEYLFTTGDAVAAGGTLNLVFGKNYSIRLDHAANYATAGPVDKNQWDLTVANSTGGATADHIDSDGLMVVKAPATVAYPQINVTLGQAGQNNHTYDFGFSPKVQIAYDKTANPPAGTVLKPGDTITYTVTAVNAGSTPVTNGLLTDDMTGVLSKADLTPTGAIPVLACVGTGPSCGVITYTAATQRFVWTSTSGNPLSPNTTASITYTVTVKAGATGNVANHLLEPDKKVEHPIITWNKVGTPATNTMVDPGQTVLYTISVRNTGTMTSLPFTVFDDLSQVVDKAELVPTTASPTITVTGPGAAVYEHATRRINWTGSLAAGQETVVTYSAVVNADATGTLRNFFIDKEVVNPISTSLAWSKVDPEAELLAGSVWSLTPLDGTNTPILAEQQIVEDCIATAVTLCTAADKDPAAGQFLVLKLKPGSYRLIETKAPVGFKLLTDPIDIVVSASATVTTIGPIENEQQSVPALPLTGGLGSEALFLAGGGLGVLTAAAWSLNLLRRRRAVKVS